MKKQEPKKQQMLEFSFKEFTPDEDRIYTEAVEKFREEITAGKTLRQAYEAYKIVDVDLRSLIQADFLKILIAERHFGQGQGLEELSKALDVSVAILKDTRSRMLQEVGATAAKQFEAEFSGDTPKTDD